MNSLRSLLLSVLFLAPLTVSSPLRAAIGVSIVLPGAGSKSDRQLTIGVQVSSTFQLQSVVATVAARQVSLTYSSVAICNPTCFPGWTGTLDLSGLPRGTQMLDVVATDVFGGSGSTQLSFVYDQMPVMTIIAPIDESVARPTIRLQVSCTDDDPAGCTSIQVSRPENPAILASGTSSIDTTISLAAFEGATISLRFTVLDSAGQSVWADRTVWIESSPWLTEAAAVGGRILDVQPDRILFRIGSGASARLAIRMLATSTDVLIDAVPGRFPTYGLLASGGALFVVNEPATNYWYLYSFRDSTLIPLGPIDSSISLRVKGDFALWSVGTSLYRYTLSSQSLDLVASSAVGNNGNDVAANGDVAYIARVPSSTPTWGYDYHVFRWSGGVSTQLTNTLGRWDVAPLAAAVNTVFASEPACCSGGTYSIGFHDGAQLITLASGIQTEPGAFDAYQVAGSWTAFLRPAIDGTLQAWLRNPAAVESQASFFGISSRLEALSDGGRLTFVSGTRRYLKLANAGAKDISWARGGRSLWLGESGYVALGRSLFRIEGSSVSAPLRFFPLTPCRALDTRDPLGPFGGPALAANGRRVITLAGTCGIPPSARSIAANVTIVNAASVGDLRFSPASDLLPPASTVNFAAGQTRASSTVLLLDGAGTVAIQNDAATQVTIVLDVSGWFE